MHRLSPARPRPPQAFLREGVCGWLGAGFTLPPPRPVKLVWSRAEFPSPSPEIRPRLPSEPPVCRRNPPICQRSPSPAASWLRHSQRLPSASSFAGWELQHCLRGCCPGGCCHPRGGIRCDVVCLRCPTCPGDHSDGGVPGLGRNQSSRAPRRWGPVGLCGSPLCPRGLFSLPAGVPQEVFIPTSMWIKIILVSKAPLAWKPVNRSDRCCGKHLTVWLVPRRWCRGAAVEPPSA